MVVVAKQVFDPYAKRRNGASPPPLFRRLAPATFTLAQLKHANQSAPAKPTNKRKRLAALETLASTLSVDPNSTLNLVELAGKLSLLPDVVPANEAEFIKDHVVGAARTSCCVPILAPFKMELNRSWVKVLALVEEKPAQMRRFVAWAVLREIEPEEIDDSCITAFLRDYEQIVEPCFAKWGTAGIVEALTKVAAAHGDLIPNRLTPIVSDGRPRLHPLSDAMTTDVAAYLEGRSVEPTCEPRDPLSRPGRIAEASASQLAKLFKAAAHAVHVQAATADIDAIADLAAKKTFTAMVQGLLWQCGGEPTAYERNIATCVISAAERYVRVGADAVAALKAISLALGAESGASRSRAAVFRSALARDFCERVVNAPARIRRAGRATARRDVQILDHQAAIAIDLLIAAPRYPAELVELAFGSTVVMPRHFGGLATVKTRPEAGAAETFQLDRHVTDSLFAYRDFLQAYLGREPDFLFVDPLRSGAAAPFSSQKLAKTITIRLKRI